MKTIQECFDIAVTGLLKQGKKSVFRSDISATGFQCRYRGEKGTKCAVGMLIDDEHYDDDIECEQADQKPVLGCLEASGCPVDDMAFVSLMMDMQSIHDNTSVSDWADEFYNLAGKYGLSTAVLD